MDQDKSRLVVGIKQRPDIDSLADEVMRTYVEFNESLTAKGKFPFDQFKVFYNTVVRYADATKKGSMIHRNVASAVNGFRETLELVHSRTPGKALAEADRLECIFFSGYDPHFDGFEPPDL
jgi:hypothetical protein